MMNFEMCPRCCHIHQLPVERLKPMVLSGCETQMQCDVCNNSFKLRDCKAIIELARHQREKRYER